MLTVVLATHDGEATLARVLDSYAGLAAPAGGWRLIVVDNASTDGTAARLAQEEELGRLPLVVRREERPGKNRALNAALGAVEGDLVVFTDDDVLPAPDWLVKLRAAADQQPDYDVFGGTIRPLFEQPPPAWLSDGAPLGVLYAATERAAGPCPADAVWGPNMAIRRRVFEQGYRFDPAVGPGVGSQYPMGSETELTGRLARGGHRAWFVADAVVHHLVRAHQLTEAFARGRAFRHGFGVCRYQPALAASRWPRLLGVPLRILPEIAFWRACAAAARLLPPSRLRFRAVWQGAWWAGAVRSMQAHQNAASRGEGA